MTTGMIAVGATALVAAALLALRYARARADRRLAAFLRRVDEELRPISQSLEEAVGRAVEARQGGVGDRRLNLNFEGLLERIVAEAATRTGAEKAALRVRGLGETPVVATFHATDGVDWGHDSELDRDAEASESRLVVPIVEGGTETGVLVAQAWPERLFLPWHERALRELADDAAPDIANARRFTRAGQRLETDELTGIRNRNGYEVELDREVANALRTGRPLSLVILDLDDLRETVAQADHAGAERALQEFARVLTRVTRSSDIVCRRGRDEFGVLLPETTAEGARRFHRRVSEEVSRTTFSQVGPMTFSAGLVEWRANETGNSFDARARAAVGRAAVGPAAVERPPRAVFSPLDAGHDAGGDAIDAPGTR